MHIKKKQKGRPCRNRFSIDKGTKELREKRKQLLEKKPEQGTALAESLLGILYGRDMISTPLYEAGRFFGELGYRYEACLGHQFRQNSSALTHKRVDNWGTSPLDWQDEEDERRTQAWRKALWVLKQEGIEPYMAVLEVVFYDQDLYTFPIPFLSAKRIEPLRQGLHSLAVYFKDGLRGKRGTLYDQEQSLAQSTRFQPFLRECQSCSPP